MAEKQSKIKLNIISPFIECDGNAVALNKEGSVNLIFFQAFNSDGEIRANSVSAIRLSVEQVEQLNKSLEKILEDAKEKK